MILSSLAQTLINIFSMEGEVWKHEACDSGTHLHVTKSRPNLPFLPSLFAVITALLFSQMGKVMLQKLYPLENNM